MATTLRKLLYADGMRARMLRGGFGSLVVKAANVLLAFVVAVVLARALGPGGYGVYAFAFAVMTLIAIPIQRGLPQLVVRETAKARGSGDWPLINGLWHWSLRIVVVFSVCVIGFGATALWFATPWMDAERAAVLATALLLVPCIALVRIWESAIRGMERVVIGQVADLIIRPAGLIVLAGGYVLLVSTPALTPMSAMALHVVAAAFAAAMALSILSRAKPLDLRQASARRERSHDWRQAALPLAMIGGLQVVNTQADVLMLGLFRSDEEVGIYRVVVQMAMLVVFGLAAINQVLHPQLARMYEQGDHRRLQLLVTRSAQVVLCLAVVTAALFVVWGGHFLALLFGASYTSGALSLAILALGQLVSASMGSVATLLNMTGHERDTMRGVGAAAVANVVLNLALIPPYGMEGAAVATALTLVLWNTLLAYVVYRRIGVVSSAIRLRRWRAD